MGSNEKTIIKELYDSAQKLERSTILKVPPQTISEVAFVVVAAVKMDVEVEWTDRILSELTGNREHINLLEEARHLKKKIEQQDREKDEAIRRLREIDAEMVIRITAFILFIILESML